MQKSDTQESILSTPIFYNPEITVGRKPLYNRIWYSKGIFCINDLLTENGSFYSQNEFENIYNIKTNFIEYQGVMQVVKLYARRKGIDNFNKKLECPLIPNTILLFTKSKKGGKVFYSALHRNEDKPTSQLKWETIYNIEEETWKTIYLSPFKLNLGRKLHWFQIKINHRILATRKYFYTIKLIQQPNCLHCNQDETISHMLSSCHHKKIQKLAYS